MQIARVFTIHYQFHNKLNGYVSKHLRTSLRNAMQGRSQI